MHFRPPHKDATDTLEGSCTISLYEYYKKILFVNDLPTVNLGYDCLSSIAL